MNQILLTYKKGINILVIFMETLKRKLLRENKIMLPIIDKMPIKTKRIVITTTIEKKFTLLAILSAV